MRLKYDREYMAHHKHLDPIKDSITKFAAKEAHLIGEWIEKVCREKANPRFVGEMSSTAVNAYLESADICHKEIHLDESGSKAVHVIEQGGVVISAIGVKFCAKPTPGYVHLNLSFC